jgi:hypothetical protein
LNDAIKRAPINNQIFDDGKRFGPPRFDGDGVAVLEMTHVKLTGGGRHARAVSASVDHHAAGSTNSFPAIAVKRHRIFASQNQPLVQDVQHFKKRHVGAHIRHLIGNPLAVGVGFGLPPYF